VDKRHTDTYAAIDPKKADLSGKVVLVTGASRGIGRTIAVSFAQAGASGVVILARGDPKTSEAAVQAAQRPGTSLRVLSVAADVTDSAQVESAVKCIKETFGRLDILVNNAGYSERVGATIAESDPNDWWKVWEINMRGTYNVTRAAIPLMIECGAAASIVNVSSVVAHWVRPTWSAYQVSKFSVLRFTELTVAEYGDKGIFAFCVHPCATPTDLNENLPEEIKKRLVDTPELAAHTIVWLVKERREWLSGRYLSCKWDVEELLAKKDHIVGGDKLKLRMVV